MPALNTISIDKLQRLIGVPQAPALIDVRTEEDFALSPSLIPGSLRRPHDQASQWAPEFGGRSAIVICHQGLKLGQGVAERFNATPYDVENVFWSHRGEKCTFDVMLDEFGLMDGPLAKLAMIVRGADTSRMDLAPQAAGLLAVSLGLSRMYADDLEQLEAGMLIYDALYRWCRDATDETHNWHSAPKKKS